MMVFAQLSVVSAQESALQRLDTGDEIRGWDAVGRLNMGKRSFCTGALIAPNLVLTAAHCLFDSKTGVRINPKDIEFLAGWRNGRAAAYRGVKHAVAHPEYVYGGGDKLTRVSYDLALLELDQPIRMVSITPFETDLTPHKGDAVGVVSYAKDRSEAPSLQEVCHVLNQEERLLVLSCNVDFGSSGAPIFSIRDGVARVVSVVSSKADYGGEAVALGTNLQGPLQTLKASLEAESSPFQKSDPSLRAMEAGAGSTAKFIKP
ncbi:serine protease [Pseudorhodobacter sp. W20_MBD10_FR17]|uniref:trypsin-like serine peptidase n=1 Tax=Pseudorhodobacter sp. W20_MBD10_FR17 TaxID=3240266 RepID=UPI003F97D709